VEDTVDGAAFGARLLNPIDPFLHPDGEAAWDDVSRVAGAGVGFARDAVSDPASAVARVKGGLEGWAEDLSVKTDPEATPVADTFRGEVDRQFGIGLNQGGLLFDAATLPGGGAAIKGLSRMGKAARELKTVTTMSPGAYRHRSPRTSSSPIPEWDITTCPAGHACRTFWAEGRFPR
jgi:hypothetical protein